ncbi:MAG: MFS transporter [Flavobacterium sp.]|nr:MFS transporter [Flavobacterium sp.]
MLIAAIALVTIILISLSLPNVQSNTETNLKEQLNFFTKGKAWLIIAITAIGFGGLFSWISYIAPMLTQISGFEAENVPYILSLAGLGMVVGNIFGGYLSDRFAPEKTILILLCLMAFDLIMVYFVAQYPITSLVMVL